MICLPLSLYTLRIYSGNVHYFSFQKIQLPPQCLQLQATQSHLSLVTPLERSQVWLAMKYSLNEPFTHAIFRCIPLEAGGFEFCSNGLAFITSSQWQPDLYWLKYFPHPRQTMVLLRGLFELLIQIVHLCIWWQMPIKFKEAALVQVQN